MRAGKGLADTITNASLPEVFGEHQRGCKGCQQWVEGKPATLALVCVVGAPMVKRLLEISAAPALAKKRRLEREAYKATEGKYKTTPIELRKVMRYKGEE
jgi:hypothetical protein